MATTTPTTAAAVAATAATTTTTTAVITTTTTTTTTKICQSQCVVNSCPDIQCPSLANIYGLCKIIEASWCCWIGNEDPSLVTIQHLPWICALVNILPPPYISRYLQPGGGGGISKLQYFNCHSASIAALQGKIHFLLRVFFT